MSSVEARALLDADASQKSFVEPFKGDPVIGKRVKEAMSSPGK